MFRKRTLSHSALSTELHKYHLMKARWCAAAAAASARFSTCARARLLRPAQHGTQDFLSPLRCAGSCFFSSSAGQSSQSNQYGPPVAAKGFPTLLNYIFSISLSKNEMWSCRLNLRFGAEIGQNSIKFSSHLKLVHFKKTVAQSSFLSKVLSFLLKSKQSQRKWQHFWKKWGLRNCLLKMNGL